jgi:hypothetical protein
MCLGSHDAALCSDFWSESSIGYIHSLFYVAGRIVTTSQHSTSIWKLDGSLVHSISFQEDLITCCDCSTTSEIMFSMPWR